MDLKVIVLSALATISVASCAEKEIPVPETPAHDFSIKAQFNELNKVKTILASGGKVDWLAADKIGVYDSATEATVEFVNTTGDASVADFAGSLSDDADKTTLYAIYPYSASNSAGIGTFSAVLPSEQTAASNTFATDLSISVGKSAEGAITFKNACALLKFKINTSDVARVTFSGYNGAESVAGGCSIAMSDEDGSISVTAASDAAKSVSLVPSGDAATLAPGFYYLVILPGSFPNGIKMTLTGADSEVLVIRKAAAAIEFVRSTITDLGALDSTSGDQDPVDLSVNGTANCYYVSQPGTLYSFDATKKGNGIAKTVGNLKYTEDDLTIAPKSVLVLWYNCLQENSASWRNACPIQISTLKLTDDGKAQFRTPDTFVNGNLVIVALDQALSYADIQATDYQITNAEVLWSWNIVASENYTPDNGAVTVGDVTVMNRDLGAIIDPRNAETPTEFAAGCGNYYQWGRKDPFPTPSSIYYEDGSKALIQYSQDGLFFTPTYTPIPALSRGSLSSHDQQVKNQIFSASIADFGITAPYWAATNTFLDAATHSVKNPHIYYYQAPSQSAIDNVRWFSIAGNVYKEAWGESSGKATAEKTIYDPCPQGWKVMSHTDWLSMIESGVVEPTVSSDNLTVNAGNLVFPIHPFIASNGWIRDKNDPANVKATAEYYSSTGGWFLAYINSIYAQYMSRYGFVLLTTANGVAEYVNFRGGNPAVDCYNQSCSDNNGMPVRCVRE